MNPFQLVALPTLALLFLASLLSARDRERRFSGLAWMVVWAAGALAVARPELARDAAHAVGIGRGVDLVMYCAILALFGVVFRLFGLLRRIESDLTTVVRELALLRGELERGD